MATKNIHVGHAGVLAPHRINNPYRAAEAAATPPAGDRPQGPGLGYRPVDVEKPLGPSLKAVLISPPEAPADVQFQPTAVSAPNQPPTVGATTRSPTGAMQTSCNPANDTRTISVAASDDRGVAQVVLRWSGPDGSGQRTMTRSGSVWVATLGPFTNAGTASYRAVATDVEGSSASSPTASIAVDPCPG